MQHQLFQRIPWVRLHGDVRVDAGKFLVEICSEPRGFRFMMPKVRRCLREISGSPRAFPVAQVLSSPVVVFGCRITSVTRVRPAGPLVKLSRLSPHG